MKGFFDFPTLISFFLGLVIYILGIYPLLQTFINGVLPTMDSTSAFFLQLAPAMFFIAMFVSIFQYALGQKGNENVQGNR